MLNFKKRLWIVKQKERAVLTDNEIAISQRITRRAVQKIWFNYNSDGIESLKDKPKGRRPTETAEDILKEILKFRKEHYGIRKIHELLKQRNMHASIKRIHKELKIRHLVKAEPKKGKRYDYKDWERDHSNSLWQTDFSWIPKLDCWLTAWLDDHSRFITIANYVTEATTDTAISLFEKAAKKYGYPRETLSDQGTQYCSQLGKTCRFLEHMKLKGVNHIYASVKSPTTTGKMERFWLTHNTERWRFNSLKKFVNYYNYKRPHMSLNYLTPYEVYVRDLR